MTRRVLLLAIAAADAADAVDVKDELRKRFDAACHSENFMGVASVAADGKTVFQAACGWADAEWGVKNTVDTRFLIYSVTKQFTAAAVLLLLEEKRFRLTDPIGKYVPGLPTSWQSATIHQLLTHTSGVPIYTSAADQKGYNPELKSVDAESIPNCLLVPVRARPLMFPHGTKFTYNNTGYVLLGMLIEKVSGARYEEFLQRRIFDRLAMRDSGYADPRRIVARKARGYVLAGKELRNADLFDPRIAWSAGALYSTVQDLTIWSDALSTGRILNADSTQRMLGLYPETALNTPDHETAHYGYGIVLTRRLGQAIHYHGGGHFGFTSVLQNYPQVKMTIVVLSNLDSDSGAMASWTMGDHLAKIWLAAQGR